MGSDRITELRIEGLRTLADVRLQLDGLTVLIGDNSSGKSSLLEACELLRKASEPNFFQQLHAVHGGLGALLRIGAPKLSLAVRLASRGGPEPDLEYGFSLAQHGAQTVIEAEWLRRMAALGPPLTLLDRTAPEGISIYDAGRARALRIVVSPKRLLLTSRQVAMTSDIERVLDALASIEVHQPVDVLPVWVGGELHWASPLRTPMPHADVDRLGLKGANLANAYDALRNDPDPGRWQETMMYVRLGLGDDVEEVDVHVDRVERTVSLRLKYACFTEPVPASALSDGTLAWLAFVALYRLGKRGGLLAFDEPEGHIHPHLLMRVLDLFEAMADDRPVVLATHSDRLLDGLDDPARSVVLCELDHERATRLIRPDEGALSRWLARYRGLGDLRSAGHASSVLTREAS